MSSFMQAAAYETTCRSLHRVIGRSGEIELEYIMFLMGSPLWRRIAGRGPYVVVATTPAAPPAWVPGRQLFDFVALHEQERPGR